MTKTAGNRIVVLDGLTLNPGDLSWDGLRSLGPCQIHDRSAEDQVVPRASGADILLTNKTPLPRPVLESLPQLKYVGVLASGYNVVDAAAARERGVVVTNVPGYSTASVAQMVFAHILEQTLHVGHHANAVRAGRWSASPDFCFWDSPLIELSGLTLGIVGFGQIGRAVGAMARSFGMRVLVSTRRPLADAPADVERVPLDDLFAASDVVTLHVPLTEETRGLVNARRLSRMKKTALLINTGRGPLVNEAELAEALNAGVIAGAGLDVLSEEPPAADNPLLAAKNCLITPHIAWATTAARRRLMDMAVANIRAFLDDKPVNVVNN